VPTPLTDALIAVTSAITDTDYRVSGRTLERLGLAGLDPAGLREKLT
jgi:hypothetical protein